VIILASPLNKVNAVINKKIMSILKIKIPPEKSEGIAS
jgi:hypothetical protein